MRRIILVLALSVQMVAQSKVPTGVIPPDGVQKIQAALTSAKADQMAAMAATQKAKVSAQNVGYVVDAVKTQLELDTSWDFNPSYYDTKSADYHLLKFIKRPEAVKPAASADAGQAPAASNVPQSATPSPTVLPPGANRSALPPTTTPIPNRNRVPSGTVTAAPPAAKPEPVQ